PAGRRRTRRPAFFQLRPARSGPRTNKSLLALHGRGSRAYGGVALQRVSAGLAGADADRLVQGVDENLAVADLAGVGGLADRLHCRIDALVDDGDLDLDLRQEIDHVLGAAVQLGVTLLAAEALDLGHGDAGHAQVRQRLAHFVELEGFDDGDDQLHDAAPALVRSGASILTVAPALVRIFALPRSRARCTGSGPGRQQETVTIQHRARLGRAQELDIGPGRGIGGAPGG